MSALVWKVYDDQGVMQGATRDPTLAATLVMHLAGGRVKHDGRIVYRQSAAGKRDGDGDAGGSYDLAAEIMLRNVELHRLERERRARMRADRRRALEVRNHRMARLETN